MQKTKKRHLEEKVMAKVSVCIKKPRNREFFNGEKNYQRNNSKKKKKLRTNTSVGSVTQSCLTPWDPMDCSMPGLPVDQQLPELTQTHVHRVGNDIQTSHPLLSPSPPAFNLCQHQGLFQWVSSLHQVAKVLELQHQTFQRIFRTDFL